MTRRAAGVLAAMFLLCMWALAHSRASPALVRVFYKLLPTGRPVDEKKEAYTSRLLGCSEYSERARHATEVERAIGSGGSGMPTGIANSVMDTCGGKRHDTAHGRAAQPRTGNHGLLAGAAVAKDNLGAFLAMGKGNATMAVRGAVLMTSLYKLMTQLQRDARQE